MSSSRPEVLKLRIRCPTCSLEALGTSADGDWTCSQCGSAYRNIRGVIDLRAPAGHPESVFSRKEQLILSSWDRPLHELEGPLGRLLVAEDGLGPQFEASWLKDRAAQAERGPRMFRLLSSGLPTCVVGPNRVAVDLACGPGTLLPSLCRAFGRVIGIDHSLFALLYARRLLEDMGLRNHLLLCASAYRIPLPSASVDIVFALNVLEHVLDRHAFLAEVRRILGPGGAFAADSRNRFDLLFPEPHVSLRLLGLLPRPLQIAYVRLRRGRRDAEFYAESTDLLSRRSLRSLMKSYFARVRITLPDVTAYGFTEATARVLTAARSIPGIGAVLELVFPTYIAMGFREPEHVDPLQPIGFLTGTIPR